jgi:hypothetical protein
LKRICLETKRESLLLNKPIDTFLSGMEGYWLLETDKTAAVKTDECTE